MSLHRLLGFRTAVPDAGAPIAVAHNEEFVPRSRYASLQLQEGDRLEIVAPMQGG